MNDYEIPESGAPDNEETPRNGESAEINTDRSQTDGARSADSPGAEEVTGAYAANTEPYQNTRQQPYHDQLQSRYQQPAANWQSGTYQPQPQYPNQQYAYPPQYANYAHPSSGKATASLVLGIISLVFFWASIFAVVSVICAIIGIVLGSSARKELTPEQGQGKATAGLVCSIIGLVLSVIMLVIFIAVFATAFSYLPEFSGISM
jgi:hypothetical protein